MAAPMEVSLPQRMLQKLIDLLKLESLKFCLKIHIHVIRNIRCQVNIDYHKQHESAALIGLFHVTSSVLTSVQSYPNYRKPTQRGVQGYLSSLQQRVADKSVKYICGFLGCGYAEVAGYHAGHVLCYSGETTPYQFSAKIVCFIHLMIPT